CKILGKIGQDDVGTSTLDAQQTLQHGLFTVDPTFEFRSFYHGILPAHVVGGDGQVRVVTQQFDNVQVCQSRFHHQVIGSFFGIQGSFDQGLATVGGVHLVSFLVAHFRGRIQSVAERTVESTRILGSIAHDAYFVEVVLIEYATDVPNASIHHIRRTYNVGAGLRLCERHVAQYFQRFVVYNFTVYHNAVVAVGAIRVHGDVRHQHHIREVFLDFAD